MRDEPTPRTNPPEPKYNHESHRWAELTGSVIDAPSKKQSQKTDFEIAIDVEYSAECTREGCMDSKYKVNHLYAVNDLVNSLECSNRHIEYPEEIGEYVRQVDFDAVKVICPVCSSESDRVTPRKVTESVEGSEICHGSPTNTNY